MKIPTRKKMFIGFIILGIVFYAVSLYVNSQQSQYVAKLQLLIANQETTLISLAELTDRNGADAKVAGIVIDCETEDRSRFNSLLNNLSELNPTELKEIDQLFGGCAGFFAKRKSLMTARLEREYEVYSDYVSLLDVVDSRADEVVYPVTKWEELVGLELERAENASELVLIQKEIINALLDGESIQSEAMFTQVNNAQEINDTLSYTGVRIDKLREDIIDL